ncbi:MAG TPA: DEAD/DEAH box helicase, partial [Gemmatimonadales bacterium]|nr:DEAD/DEAH box helicase [Gemmatimonadales bacterium]
MPRWVRAPTIIAEALVGVSDPLLSALSPLEEVTPGEVAAALAQSLALPEASDTPPGWLLPEQVCSFRRIIAALRAYHGALLADPVGSGKTYVALAAASVLNRGTTACIVPATLVRQWEATASRLSVPIVVCSHEQVSRGRLPRRTRGLVIIDECHRFRNPNTRRYEHIARWLIGRPALLVTATPVVNRLEDLAFQLLLAVRDTALSSEGIVSIREALSRASPLPSLGRIVVEADTAPSHRPRRLAMSSAPSISECREVGGLVHMLDRLRLSRCPPIARLIRATLLRSAGSSPAALAGALRRYQRLLLHARDALYAGQRFDRAELRRFSAELGDQLVWWELFPDSGAEAEIELSDLEMVSGLIAKAESAAGEPDPKVEQLRSFLKDGIPTLVFTNSRDTVRHLRKQLSEFRIAWCTGDLAGIGATRAPRQSVLAWFRQATNLDYAPQHLVVTDVAAEGLDLQRAARVVHYDLPWTPMRLEQREGRSVRRGSHNGEVEVIRFHPPELLEKRLKAE